MQDPKEATRQMRDYFRQFARNFRWGTCVYCPRDTEGHVYPEFCGHTERNDHQGGAEFLFKTYQAFQHDLRTYEAKQYE